ncbi:M56 family metallopeptidase [Paenibacillus sp. L3-i20]|uniref:M56 family metallopeptidase n=1 Tax=Paenibacillus sp. L3-i20 TaxID=2905833 RepID=UPI001EE106FD|nr:M56 family metallopeptidase [Paenibacillus sp. L3-i20]GKU75671.1 hypothetical protein L3i20_v200680 [Paenibacillus sp. L3-i20]
MKTKIKPSIGMIAAFAVVSMCGLFIIFQMVIFFLHHFTNLSLPWLTMSNMTSQQSIIGTSITVAFVMLLLKVIPAFSLRVYRTIQFKHRLLSCRDNVLTTTINKQFSLYGNRVVVINEPSFVALTIGFFSPIIIISSQVIQHFTKQELESILLHEYHHVNMRDPLKKVIVDLFGEFVFFVPLMKRLTAYYHTKVELLADRFAIEMMKSSEPLGFAILKLAKLNVKERSSYFVSGFTEATNNYRIQQILEPDEEIRFSVFQPRSVSVSIIVWSLNIGLFISCLSSEVLMHTIL